MEMHVDLSMENNVINRVTNDFLGVLLFRSNSMKYMQMIVFLTL